MPYANKQNCRTPNLCQERDDNRVPPVGKGWIYQFTYRDKIRPSENGRDWLQLSAKLDDKTKKTLEEQGIKAGEANFEATKTDLIELEKHGYLTLLDKKYPPSRFDYNENKMVYVECGKEEIELKTKWKSTRISGSAGAAVELTWFDFIKAKLGLQVEAESEMEKKVRPGVSRLILRKQDIFTVSSR